MKPIVRVVGLSKQYRIGQQRAGYETLRESIVRTLRAPLNHLRNSARTSHTIWALKDINFEVAPGEVVGIIGSNGAGKSTLLKTLSRITEPTQGRAELYGRLASLLEVGTGFHPELTGRENIYLNGAILGMRKLEIDRKFDEIVAFAELAKFLETPVKHYSSGMYMRLAFAVASHLEPEILLVDEVLAVGDAAFQKKCLGKMGEVAKHGRTVLFVSHNLTAVRSLCGRAIWIDKGQIVKAGETEEVLLHYVETVALPIQEQTWDDVTKAPGNDLIRIRAARVSAADQEITVESPIRLEFDYWNGQPDATLNLTMHLHTAEGVYVLATGSGAKPRPQGLLRESVTIPPQFLNDGIYTVTIQFVQDSRSLYIHPEILVFEVTDSFREGSWFGKWPGVVRPKFEWLSECLVDSGNRS